MSSEQPAEEATEKVTFIVSPEVLCTLADWSGPVEIRIDHSTTYGWEMQVRDSALRATLADMTQQRNRYRAESKRLRDQLKIPVDKPTGQA